MKKYIIYYHNSRQETNINRCWGNSISFEINAIDCIQAIKNFNAKHDYPIYSISINDEVSLGYDATQSLLKFENLA